jgi:hypothetical protein
MFPADTFSGAPKIRAMQIIAELAGTTRGPYGGCVGYFSFNGNLDTCITIRTALLKDGKAYVQAGGGLGERLRTRSGISGNGEQEQSHAQSRGAGGDVCEDEMNGCSLTEFSASAASNFISYPKG